MRLETILCSCMLLEERNMFFILGAQKNGLKQTNLICISDTVCSVPLLDRHCVDSISQPVAFSTAYRVSIRLSAVRLVL